MFVAQPRAYYLPTVYLPNRFEVQICTSLFRSRKLQLLDQFYVQPLNPFVKFAESQQ